MMTLVNSGIPPVSNGRTGCWQAGIPPVSNSRTGCWQAGIPPVSNGHAGCWQAGIPHLPKMSQNAKQDGVAPSCLPQDALRKKSMIIDIRGKRTYQNCRMNTIFHEVPWHVAIHVKGSHGRWHSTA
jgi:hypothetical protein